VTSLTAAWNALPNIAMLSNTTVVSPTFFIANTFTNSLGLGIDALLTVEALSAGYDIVGPGGQGGIGPLYALNKEFDVADFPGLYDFTFELGGFNPVTADSFAINVPEPGTLALLAIALLAVGAARRSGVERPARGDLISARRKRNHRWPDALSGGKRTASVLRLSRKGRLGMRPL
jgi:hypothetical protein